MQNDPQRMPVYGETRVENAVVGKIHPVREKNGPVYPNLAVIQNVCGRGEVLLKSVGVV